MSSIGSQPIPPLSAAGGDHGGGAVSQKFPDWVKAVLGAFGALALAIITLLASFGTTNWTSAQTGLAIAEVAAVVAFLTACAAHFWPGTQKEPVAVGGTFTALVAATLALLSGFKVWTLTQPEVSALVGLITALLAVGTALFARGQVTAMTTAAHQVALADDHNAMP